MSKVAVLLLTGIVFLVGKQISGKISLAYVFGRVGNQEIDFCIGSTFYN